MKPISSEAVSSEYIHINSCGCQHLPVSHISGMLGIQNQYYFSRFFKKNTDISPTEYRRLCSGQN